MSCRYSSPAAHGEFAHTMANHGGREQPRTTDGLAAQKCHDPGDLGEGPADEHFSRNTMFGQDGGSQSRSTIKTADQACRLTRFQETRPARDHFQDTGRKGR